MDVFVLRADLLLGQGGLQTRPYLDNNINVD